MDVIKTENINGQSLTLVYFDTIKGYEVQLSKVDGDCILDSDGIYTALTDGLKVWNAWADELRGGKKYGYVKIMLDDSLGGGLDYQLNRLTISAENIGLKVEFVRMELKEVGK